MSCYGYGKIPLLPLSAEREATLREERETLMRLLGAANKEIKRLQAIIDQYPKAADGMPIAPGMRLWAIV